MANKESFEIIKPTKPLIEYNGEKKTVDEWSLETGIALQTIKDRLKRGWSAEQTLTTVPNSVANQPHTSGRQLKDGVVNSFYDVWNKSGKKEFERQLKDAFKQDALKTVRDFAGYLPKDAIERTTAKEEKAVIRIELMQPQENRPTFTVEANGVG